MRQRPEQISSFAQQLAELLDKSNVASRRQWAAMLDVTRSAISQWVLDRTLPRPDKLRMIVERVRNAESAPAGLLAAWGRIVSQPAGEVTPHGGKIGGTILDYLLAPELEGAQRRLRRMEASRKEQCVGLIVRLVDAVDRGADLPQALGLGGAAAAAVETEPAGYDPEHAVLQVLEAYPEFIYSARGAVRIPALDLMDIKQRAGLCCFEQVGRWVEGDARNTPTELANKTYGWWNGEGQSRPELHDLRMDQAEAPKALLATAILLPHMAPVVTDKDKGQRFTVVPPTEGPPPSPGTLRAAIDHVLGYSRVTIEPNRGRLPEKSVSDLAA